MTTTSDARSGDLRRQLGVMTASLMVVGGIIGSGIFFTPSEVARALPSGAWILGTWVLGGVVAFAGALTYAELGAMMPEAGGPYVYIRAAFGRLPAFLYGWMSMLVITTAAIAAVAMSFASYVGRMADLAPLGGELPLAATVIVAITALNVIGVRPGAFAQNALTVAKIVALALLIVGGLALWGRMGPPPVAAAPSPPSLPVGFATAFVAVLFTIGGWQQMNMVAGEIRDPARAIPRALALGIGIVVALYLGANLVYLHALGRDGLAISRAVAADTARGMLGAWGATLITVAVMLSILGFVTFALLANARVLFALSRDGVFLRAAAAVHPRFGTPHVALLILGGWSLFLLLVSRGSLGPLLSGVVFADWIFFGLGAASIFVLRRTMPNAERPYRALAYPWLPAFFVGTAVAGVVSAFVASPRTSLLGTVLLIAGVLVFRFRARAMAR